MNIQNNVLGKVYQTKIENVLAQSIKKHLRALELEKELQNNQFNGRGLDLASGYPGILLMLNELNKVIEIKDVEVLMHRIMNNLVQELKKTQIHTPGLWTGISGITYVLNKINKETSNYQNLLNKMNALSYKVIKKLIVQIKGNLISGNENLDSHFDVINGLAGIARFCLEQDNEDFNKLLKEIIVLLIELTERSNKIIRFKGPFDNEPYNNFGISHGTAGILAIISICKLKGFSIEGDVSAIKKLVKGFMEYCNSDSFGPFWPGKVSETEYNKKEFPKMINESWCYGNFGIARSIWLAGEALGNKTFQSFSIDSFKGSLNRPIDYWNIHSVTICHGYAGMLHVAQRMYKESLNQNIKELRDYLLEIVLEHFSIENKYGFQSINIINGKEIYDDSLGMLDGSSGVLLVLASQLDKMSPKWDEALLVN